MLGDIYLNKMGIILSSNFSTGFCISATENNLKFTRKLSFLSHLIAILAKPLNQALANA